jgi:hypothetical protein
MNPRARRWVSEGAVLAEMERLNDVSESLVQDFARMAPQAAEAEAVHKAMRAKRVLTAKANGVKSIAEAEYIAEADDDVAAAYLDRLTRAAELEATREALRSLRTNQDALRTAAASARDSITGPGWRGPHEQRP